MIPVKENVSLKSLNTFGIEATAKYYAEINSVEDFRELIKTPQYKSSSRLVLGGGSNILFTKNFDGIVIKNQLRGIEIVKEDADTAQVRAAAGEVWHDFVMWCIRHELGGLENLSLIPGCVGASPMQNIGAYGVEIKDVFVELEAYDMESGERRVFKKDECHFGYRESVFKRELRDRYLIGSVTYSLSKVPQFNTSYGAINTELESMGVKTLSLEAVSQAVINIRSSKLPDPKKTGNAGSFFKNPEVDNHTYQRIKEQYPNVVAYPLGNGHYKLAAGWLIEQSGLKGYTLGEAGVHDKQALVLINRGHAKGSEIFNLSEHVLQVVFTKFGVKLEREVNII